MYHTRSFKTYFNSFIFIFFIKFENRRIQSS